MARSTSLIFHAAALVVLGGRALPALAQDQPAPQPPQQPAPAPAAPGAPAQPAAPAAPAVDSNLLYVGEWDYTAQLRDGTMDGVWQINYANGRFTGLVTRSGLPPSPIRSVRVRDHFRNVDVSVDFNGETYVFSGHLDNARNITGTLSAPHSGMGRLRAQKRG